MIHSMKSLLFVVCAAALPVMGLGAQGLTWDPQPRGFVFGGAWSDGTVVRGDLEGLGNLAVIPAGSQTGASVSLGSGDPGGTFGSDQFVLASQINSLLASSEIHRVSIDPNTAQVALDPDVISFVGRAIAGLAVDPSYSEIVVWDAASRSVLRADFSVTGALPAASDFTVSADLSSFIDNDDAWAYHVVSLAHMGTEAGVFDYAVTPFFSEEQPAGCFPRLDLPRYFLNASAQPFVVEERMPFDAGLAYGFNVATVTDALASVPLYGRPGQALSIVNISDGSVVGTGIVPANGLASVAVSGFLPGQIYGVRDDVTMKVTTPYVTPVETVGSADALPFGRAFRDWSDGVAMDAHIGNDRFVAGLVIDNGGTSGVTNRWPAALLVGTAVIPQGNRMVVQGQAFFSEVVFADHDFPAGLAVSLPLPDIPALAGATLYVQYAVDIDDSPGVDLRYSSIMGFPLRAEPFVPPGLEDLFPEEVEALADTAAASLVAPVSIHLHGLVDSNRMLQKWFRGRGGVPSVENVLLPIMFGR